MLNIVIPMAGAGSRFSKVGYREPKPLIPVRGIPMIGVVIRNLTPRVPHRFIFVCQQTHLDRFNFGGQLSQWAPGCTIVPINGLSEGAACTVLAAAKLIDNDESLMIANSDQWVDVVIDEYIEKMQTQNLDGYIMTMQASDPKWSFVGLNANGMVSRVVEKQVISSEATVGIYNFRYGKSFVAAANKMIANEQRVNGEYYVAPVYNELIAKGHRVGIHNVGKEAEGMYGLGTPADLDLFLRLSVSERACAL